MDESLKLRVVPGDGVSARKERADAIANRQLLLETAEKLFATYGVSGVSMADIAKEAQVGKGTLYRHFNSKPEVCLALMDSQMTDFQNNMLARLRSLDEASKSNLQQLEQFLDALVYFTDLHSPLLCEVQRAGLLPGGSRAQMPYFWQHMTISGLMQRAIQQGELAPGLDIHYTADVLLAPLRVDLFLFQREVRDFSLERISAGLTTIVSALALLN